MGLKVGDLLNSRTLLRCGTQALCLHVPHVHHVAHVMMWTLPQVRPSPAKLPCWYRQTRQGWDLSVSSRPPPAQTWCCMEQPGHLVLGKRTVQARGTKSVKDSAASSPRLLEGLVCCMIYWYIYFCLMVFATLAWLRAIQASTNVLPVLFRFKSLPACKRPYTCPCSYIILVSPQKRIAEALCRIW